MSFRTVILALVLTTAVPALAQEVVVIVNKENNQSMDSIHVAKIYLGEVKSWVDGRAISAYDQPEDSTVRVAFSNEILHRSVPNMKVIWAQFTFSGRAVPPRQLPSDGEIKKAVAANKSAIGYIAATSLDNSVRALK